MEGFGSSIFRLANNCLKQQFRLGQNVHKLCRRQNSSQVQGRRRVWSLQSLIRRPVPILSAVVFLPTVHAFWGKKDEAPQQATASAAMSSDESLITQADDLYSNHSITELYDLLVPHKDCSNDEVMWRLARAACDKAKGCDNKEEKKRLMYEAYEYVKKALELNDQNFACHKWMAIMLDYTGEYEGTKQRIKNAYTVKEHFLKAVELNPRDATSVHLVGYWCFTFADLPWYQKKVASVIFATPPSSSYEEALKYFLDAENIDPNFYSMNLLMLGKTYMKLGDKKMALLYFTRARDYPIKTEDDKQSHREAVELLKSVQ